jgi:hypothetical protein
VSFNNIKFTTKGRNLHAKAQIGAALNFTRIAIGDGDNGGASSDAYSALLNQIHSMNITKLKPTSNGTAIVGGVFNNSGLPAFYLREIGLFAMDPDLGEILYCYGNAGANAEHIPEGGGSTILERELNIIATVGNATSLTANIDYSMYATMEFTQNEVATHDTNAESHADIRERIISLGAYAVASGTNTYIASIEGITALTEGFGVKIKFTNANTGASTLNINNFGAKQILKGNGSALTSGNIKAGQICNLVYNGLNFQLLGEGGEYGTAQAQHVLDNYTIGTESGLIEGTMPNNGPAVAETVNLTNHNQEYTIAQGSHSGLRKIKAVITNLAAGVIKAGVTVGGILGTFTSDATATAAQMLAGAKAYVNGVLVTGTIPSKGAQTYTPGTTNQTISAGQYLSGIQTIAGDADLIAANIAANKNIFNVVGTYTGIKSIQTMIIQSAGAKTITGVVPNNTIIIYQEYNQQNNDEWNITLTNSTTLTVSGTPAYGMAIIIEFEYGVIKSKQRVTIGSSVAYNATVTISSVDPEKCIVLQMSAHHGSILYSTVGKVTAATTLTVWRSHSSWVDYLEVIEFY